MSLTRDWDRRESLQSIPGQDGSLSGHGRRSGPINTRYVTFAFRVFTSDLDRAYDLLAAQVAPGVPQRLVYTMDSGAQWFTLGYTPSIKQTLVSANRFGGGGYADFSVTWRIRPDWRLRFSEASDVWGNNDGVWGTADGTWGQGYVVTLSATTTYVTVDATGVAGSNLPTIPDTGPVITIGGPFGGANGIQLVNPSATTPDLTGVPSAITMTLPGQAVNSGYVYSLDCGAQKFLLNGAPFRPTKPVYQREWFRIEPGVVNTISIICLGSSPVTGGTALIDWWRKRA